MQRGEAQRNIASIEEIASSSASCATHPEREHNQAAISATGHSVEDSLEQPTKRPRHGLDDSDAEAFEQQEEQVTV